MSGKIFLNYMRDDSRWPTLSLYNLLAQSFPRERLFMDVEGYIKPGDDFVEVLEEQVSACEIMVVVIGPQWLSLAKDGGPRIFDPADFVHIEIATALRRKIRVIPALVDGAHMPGEGKLPEPLKALARRQAIRLSHERFAADGQGLVKTLLEVLGGAPKPRPAVSDPALRVRPGSGEGFRDVDAPWCPEMVVVPAGSFTMGSPDGEEGRTDGEGPQHRVTIAKPFAVGRFAVTRGEFSAFIGETGYSIPDEAEARTVEDGKWELRKGRSFRNPGFAQDDSHPVVYVNWEDAKAYTAWLSGKTGKDYRLLSEAEWEYACRAGTQTPFWWGSSISTEQANYNGNYTLGGGKKGEYRLRTVPVKSFQANPWGLYQVHGNVGERCEDCWNENYNGAPGDGSAWTAGDSGFRSLRGAPGARIRSFSARARATAGSQTSVYALRVSVSPGPFSSSLFTSPRMGGLSRLRPE